MKVHAIGVVVSKGLAKKDNQPYEIPELKTLKPIVEVNTAMRQVIGNGYEEEVHRFDIKFLDKFKSLKFPVELDLEFDQIRDDRGNLQSIVVGIKGQPASNTKAA